jgi:cobalt-zinc-cadmium efflux system membrane fusion protein
MTFAQWRGGLVLALAAALAAGCGPTENKGGEAKDKVKPPQEKQAAEKGHDHGGWWCDEHGVPEEICGQCNAKYAAECKKKGDWCKEHDRPDSQCFLCHPELKAKFAAQYWAKYGKEPPPTEDEVGKTEEARHDKKS